MFNKIKSAWNKLHTKFIMWRIERLFKQVDKKVAKSIELKEAAKKKQQEV